MELPLVRIQREQEENSNHYRFPCGWTLQELISPHTMWFYDSQWQSVGSKHDLQSELSRITRIPSGILLHEAPLSSVLVAQRMSWAAGRETTRVEDEAYYLLGIFDVNMPLLYGEESKAFRRLQEEIIKSSTDLSIFAWTVSPLHADNMDFNQKHYCGILAVSPALFKSSGPLLRSTLG